MPTNSTIRQLVTSFMFLSLCVNAFAGVAAAQNALGTVRGKVTDEQAAVLPGARVTVVQQETNTTRVTVTQNLGQYFVPNLPAGTYDIEVSLDGFVPQKRSQITLNVGQELTFDFVLKVGGVQEAVTVVAPAAILETTKNTIGSIVKKEQIDDLPVVSRDFSDLAKLAPGVTPGSGGNGDSLSFNGQRGFANGFFVDGATAEWQYYGKQSSTFVQDWIQEFQVMTNSYAAEFGTASGGILNVITRSGSNMYSGRFYGFFRDANLDSAPFAGNFENGEPQYLSEAAPFSQQRIGGFLGGPIVKDKAFFFGGLEWFNRDSSTILGISDYWRAKDLKTVLPSGTSDHPYLLKGDLNVNSANRLSVRYDRSVKKDLNQSQFGDPLDTEEVRYTFGGPVWNLVSNFTTTLGNAKFNEVRVFYGSNKAPIICNKSGTGGSEELTLAPIGTFAYTAYPGAVFGCPIFTGLEGETNLHLTDNFSFSTGAHQFKVGAQLQRVHTIIDVTNFHDGYWVHNSDAAFNINDPSTYPDQWIGNVGPAKTETEIWSPYFFAQDTWQANRNVTLNLGVRYDIDRSAQAGNDFVDSKNQRIVARYGGGPLLQKTNVDYNNVAPRLGVVWTPTADRRTTIRGAAGLFFDQNHNNFNAIYLVNTLLSDGFINFDANSPLTNPFYNPADPAGSANQLRSFLARNYPYFPDLSLAPISKETINRNDPDMQVPYTAQYTVGFAHNFGNNLTLEADYVYTRGEGILLYIDDNVQLVNGEYIQPDPRFGAIATLRNVGHSRYNGLLTQTEYRWKRSRVGVSYTLSKTTSNANSVIFGNSPTNPLDLSEDQGPDTLDRRHNLVINGSALLPYDVQLAGIGTFRSALPYSATTPLQLDEDPFSDRPEPRNSRRGDSESSVDLRISKIFRIRNTTVTGFWEIFDLFNTTNFTNFQGNLLSSSFGLPLGAQEQRRQQFGFRFDF